MTAPADLTVAELWPVLLGIVTIGGLWWRTGTARSAYEARLAACARTSDVVQLERELLARIESRASRAEVIQHATMLHSQAQALAVLKAELEGLSSRIDERLDYTDKRITELLDLVRRLVPPAQ